MQLESDSIRKFLGIYQLKKIERKPLNGYVLGV